ncbi:MAG: HAD family hydrolase [Candidatus Sericytochromatia bacterium]
MTIRDPSLQALSPAPASPPFQLVIFDCDGVLVDSERVTQHVLVQILNELGLSLTLQEVTEQFLGRSMSQYLALLTDLLGQAPPPDFETRLRARFRQALENQLTAVPGIEGVLAGLTIPYCVASNGDVQKMQLMLGMTGLWSLFEHNLFTVAQVALPKPAPDLFLYAAAHYGVNPADCLVIEDSPTGVAAGVAAGMTVYAYAALTPAARLRAAGAHRVFQDMSELPVLIRHGTRS